jgi:hypothetical protein
MIPDAERRAEEERAAKIVAALRELQITREARDFGSVARWALVLAGLTDRLPADRRLDKGRPLPGFRSASTATVRAQLIKLVDRVDLTAAKMDAGGQHEKSRSILREKIMELFTDTWAALDRAIDVAWEVECGRERFDLGYFRVRLPDDLKAGRVSAATLRTFARLARIALSQEPQGRPTGTVPNLHAQAVARCAAGAFVSLTRTTPAISKSRPKKGQRALCRLTESLFEILKVQGDPDPAHHAAQAVENYFKKT